MLQGEKLTLLVIHQGYLVVALDPLENLWVERSREHRIHSTRCCHPIFLEGGREYWVMQHSIVYADVVTHRSKRVDQLHLTQEFAHFLPIYVTQLEKGKEKTVQHGVVYSHVYVQLWPILMNGSQFTLSLQTRSQKVTADKLKWLQWSVLAWELA